MIQAGRDQWRLCGPKIQCTYGDSSLIKSVKLIVKDGFTVMKDWNSTLTDSPTSDQRCRSQTSSEESDSNLWLSWYCEVQQIF